MNASLTLAAGFVVSSFASVGLTAFAPLLCFASHAFALTSREFLTRRSPARRMDNLLLMEYPMLCLFCFCLPVFFLFPAGV